MFFWRSLAFYHFHYPSSIDTNASMVPWDVRERGGKRIVLPINDITMPVQILMACAMMAAAALSLALDLFGLSLTLFIHILQIQLLFFRASHLTRGGQRASPSSPNAQQVASQAEPSCTSLKQRESGRINKYMCLLWESGDSSRAKVGVWEGKDGSRAGAGRANVVQVRVCSGLGTSRPHRGGGIVTEKQFERGRAQEEERAPQAYPESCQDSLPRETIDRSGKVYRTHRDIVVGSSARIEYP